MSRVIEKLPRKAGCTQIALLRAREMRAFLRAEFSERILSTFLAHGCHFWQCARCRSRTWLNSGTFSHHINLSWPAWDQAKHLVTQNEICTFALSRAGQLPAPCPADWQVKHVVLEAMAEREDARTLADGAVSDDIFPGVNTRACAGAASRRSAPDPKDNPRPRQYARAQR
jgi:hypothetical protein